TRTHVYSSPAIDTSIMPRTITLYAVFCLFFYRFRYHHHLHSFPTRRSSDLARKVEHGGPLRIFADLEHVRPFPDGSALGLPRALDRKSTRLNSSHVENSYAVFCLKKKNENPLRHAYASLSRILPDIRVLQAQ